MNNSNEHVTFTSHGKVYGSNPAATPSKLAEVYIPKAEQRKMRVNVETTSRMSTGDKAIRWALGLMGSAAVIILVVIGLKLAGLI